MNAELRAPGDGQRVHQAHAAAVHQVGEQRHGQQHREAGGHDGGGDDAAIAEIGVDNVAQDPHVIQCPGIVTMAPQGHRHGAQPQHGVAEQQRPEAPKVGAHQRPLRGRCREPHNRHLPSRR